MKKRLLAPMHRKAKQNSSDHIHYNLLSVGMLHKFFRCYHTIAILVHDGCLRAARVELYKHKRERKGDRSSVGRSKWNCIRFDFDTYFAVSLDNRIGIRTARLPRHSCSPARPPLPTEV